MEIASKSQYSNLIYSAVVVNDDTSSDPQGLGRVQIYIPMVHTEYVEKHLDYMRNTNKQNEAEWSIFPWATPLVEDLKNGNVVYGSYIDNKNNQYIILGLDVNNSANSSLGSGMMLSNSLISGILDLAMPIIIRNEVGISVNDWPDNISTNNYTKINPYDNGGWSIGLIQWHHSRAFDCLFQIAKADTSWTKLEQQYSELDLVQDLRKAVNSNSSSGYRNKYQDSFHPTKGSRQYNFIQAMLGSETGRKVQREYATEDTANSIEKITGEPYKITNPAIIIFLADIMNQYGAGVNTTIKAASQISAQKKDIMAELDEFREWCKNNLGSYSTYINRRNLTYSYIRELNNAGHLKAYDDDALLVNLGDADQGGTYLWPAPGVSTITSNYGWRGAIEGTSHDGANFHNGIDIGTPSGTPIIAVADGTVSVSANNVGGYGHYVVIKHPKENMRSLYAHGTRRMVNVGDTVQAGQVILVSGSTGNSSGPHLHFTLAKGLEDGVTNMGGSSRGAQNSFDPLPHVRNSINKGLKEFIKEVMT